MTFSVEKYRQEEKVRIELVKQRGDIIRVSENLNLPLDYVEKINKKLCGLRKRNVSVFAQNKLMEYLLSGSESRIRQLMDMLHYLDSFPDGEVSSCHRAMVIKDFSLPQDDPNRIRCQSCGNPCQVRTMSVSERMTLKQELIEKLRVEDEHVVNYAEKLGFTEKKDEPVVKIDMKQQNLIVDGSRISGELKVVLSKDGPLTGMDREQIRKAVERKLIEAQTGENTNGTTTEENSKE